MIGSYPLTVESVSLAVCVVGTPIAWAILAVGWVRRRRASRRIQHTS